MQMPDMPINVEVDPNEDTEWNDILRSKGIIPEKPPSPTPMIEEALTEARRLAHENRLEGKELDELAELEDEEDEDFLESYRYVLTTISYALPSALPQRLILPQTKAHGRNVLNHHSLHLQPSLPPAKARLLARRHRSLSKITCPRPPHLVHGHKY